MKLFLLLALMICASATPKVGFLQFYNQMDEPVTPYLGEKPLTMRPIQPQQASSGLLVPVGSHQLSLRNGDSALAQTQIKVSQNMTVTACAIVTKRSPKARVNPSIILFIGKCAGLKLRSVSYLRHEISLSNQSVSLLAGETHILANDFPQKLKVTVDDEKEVVYELEETTPHALLIWIGDDLNPKSALIPVYSHTVPEGLRDDFTFGRKREEIQGLKTLRASN